MNTFQRILGGILILAFSACAPSTLTVTTDYDPATNFTGLKTYDWETVPDGVIDDPSVDWERFTSLVRAAVDNELSAKGFTRQTTGPPDFLLHFHATLDKRVSSKTLRSRYFEPRFKRRRAVGTMYDRVYEWDQGTLVLDIVDQETQKYIWTGSATDRVNLSASPEQKAERINEAIKEILKRFPPT